MSVITKAMPNSYFPRGPFFDQAPDRGAWDMARENFLLNFRERTARAYRADLEHLFEWCAAHEVDALGLPTAAVEQYGSDLGAEAYARSSIRRRLSTVRRFREHVDHQ